MRVDHITMEDVAREARVSRALVSLAYRDAAGVKAETRDRILEVGRRLGYTPNRVAAQLAGRGGDKVGLYLQDLHNDLFADIHDAVRDVVERQLKHVVLSVGSIDGSRDAVSLDTLRESRVDVVIAAGLQLSDSAVGAFARRVPLVSVMRHIDGVDNVTANNRYGARVATRHLLELHHRRIVFLSNPPGDGYLERAEGFSEVMESAGLVPRIVQTTYSRLHAAADAAALLDLEDRPTAIFAHNDQAALGVLDALAARGLVAGHDVSVVGYDNSALSRFPGTSLTTVDVHSESLGRTAAELALARLADPHAEPTYRSSLPALVIRATTGPPL